MKQSVDHAFRRKNYRDGIALFSRLAHHEAFGRCQVLCALGNLDDVLLGNCEQRLLRWKVLRHVGNLKFSGQTLMDCTVGKEYNEWSVRENGDGTLDR